MKIPSVKAYLKSKSAIKQVKNTHLMEIVLFVPARKNEFDEKVGKDTYYPVTVFNSERIKQLENIAVRDKVEAELYLNSYEFVTTKEIGYNLSLTLANIKKL